MITYNDLVYALDYDPETGAFWWKNPTSNRVKRGRRADCPTGDGYVRIGLKGTRYLAHRLAWFYVHKEWPTLEIDHINRIRNDNRIVNLRLATRSENAQNIPDRKQTSSGIRHVKWDKNNKNWVVSMSIKGKMTYIGYSDSLETAAAIAAQARQLYRRDP